MKYIQALEIISNMEEGDIISPTDYKAIRYVLEKERLNHLIISE